MQIKFSEYQRNELKDKCKLPDSVIDEFEQIMTTKKSLLDYSYARPTAKEERNALISLRKSISKLSKQLNKLSPSIEAKLKWEPPLIELKEAKERTLKELTLIDDILSKIKMPKGRAGNKKLDKNLVDLVDAVVSVMVKNGITPKKRGNQLNTPLRYMLSNIDERESSAQTLIENNWDNIQEAIDFPDGVPDWEEYYEDQWKQMTPTEQKRFAQDCREAFNRMTKRK